MKKVYSSLLILSLSAFISSCSKNNENSVSPVEKTALQVANATISPYVNTDTITRVAGDGWEATDAIGILLFKSGTKTLSEGKTVYKYVTSTSAGAFSPADKENTAYYPDKEQKVDVIAFYPHAEIDADLLVPVNTLNQSNPRALDLLTAELSAGHSSASPKVDLNFKHRLVKLNIIVEKDTTLTDVDLTSAVITLDGTATSAKWSLSEEKLTDVKDIAGITIPTTLVSNNFLTAGGIVLPTPAGSGVEVTITAAGGKMFIVPLPPETELKAGTSYLLKIKLEKGDIAIKISIQVTVTSFTDGFGGSEGILNVPIGNG